MSDTLVPLELASLLKDIRGSMTRQVTRFRLVNEFQIHRP